METFSVSSSECETLDKQIPCREFYNATVMPNIFDSVSIQEAIIDFGGLNKKFSSSDEDLRKCGKNFTHFVCLMIFPPCKKPKRPSRFLCESVKAGCPESVVRNWPEKFKCNLFPERESEDYVVIGLKRRPRERSALSTLNYVTTPVNETVTLNCDTSHRSYELIEWRRNDTKTPVYLKFRNYEPEIGPSYSKRVSLVNGKDLQIQHVTLDDQSVYTCKTMKNIRLIKSLETGSYIRLTVQARHPGVCPLQSFRLSRDCGNLCNSDADCEVDSKCCFSGCDKLKRCVKSCPSRCPPCLPGEKQIFKIGRDGCQTCSCHYHKCPALLCPRRCDFGYQRDTDGCLSCNCKPPPCSSPKCSRPCLTAYLNDENGCPTCRCRPRIPCPLTRCPFGCPWYRHKIRRNMLGCQECICMKE